ncbi:hypothetical protein [Nocardia araoensis]|uniref:hypothetical protein n=1 Tax=Nocardia araoensis TaxID=228600 RepID=UPI0002DD61A5|nr:hypothetical protein [Nocardia araoensis]
MGDGKFRARSALALALPLLAIGVARRSGAAHDIRNVVNGLRGAHAARARHRRALRTRGAGTRGPHRAAPVAHRVTRAA